MEMGDQDKALLCKG